MSDDATAGDRFGLVGHVLDGRYRLDRVVGEGGFATVYGGVHLGLDVPIALKVLRLGAKLDPERQAEFIAGFRGEARTIARLKHPNIVQVLDTGVTQLPTGGEAPWMALEWLDGHTLEDDLRARRGQGGRPPADAVALLRPAFDAVAFAHEQGIAHRDLKPSNLMFVAARRGTTLKVLDFGIAKVLDPSEMTPGAGLTQTRGTVAAFSPLYAAPEQIAGTRTGPWTDVHALALVLTEVLIDATAYAGNELTAIYGEAFGSQRPTPARHGVDVGAACEAVLAKALAVRPEDRYHNAGEMLEALDAAVGASAVAPAAAVSAPSQPQRATQGAAAGEGAAAKPGTTTEVLRANAARNDPLADLAVQQMVSPAWLAKWSAGGSDPIPAAFARSRDVEAMMHTLRLAGRLGDPATLRALLREGVDLQAFGWESYRPWTAPALADAIRRAVPAAPTLGEVRAGIAKSNAVTVAAGGRKGA